MRDGRGQPNPDRRAHHLPEAEQRRGRAGLLAERGERLRGAERIDDAHAEQEYRHPPRNGRKVGVNIDTSRMAMLPVAASSRPTLDRAVEPEARRQFCRQHAGGEHDHHGARKEQAELDRRKTAGLRSARVAPPKTSRTARP